MFPSKTEKQSFSFEHIGYQPEIKQQGAPCTRDYRIKRVRLFVDGNNKITQVPHTG